MDTGARPHWDGVRRKKSQSVTRVGEDAEKLEPNTLQPQDAGGHGGLRPLGHGAAGASEVPRGPGCPQRSREAGTHGHGKPVRGYHGSATRYRGGQSGSRASVRELVGGPAERGLSVSWNGMSAVEGPRRGCVP